MSQPQPAPTDTPPRTIKELLDRFGPKVAAFVAERSTNAGYHWFPQKGKPPRVVPSLDVVLRLADSLKLDDTTIGVLVRDLAEQQKKRLPRR